MAAKQDPIYGAHVATIVKLYAAAEQKWDQFATQMGKSKLKTVFALIFGRLEASLITYQTFTTG